MILQVSHMRATEVGELGYCLGGVFAFGRCINDSIVTNEKWQKIYTCVCVRMGHWGAGTMY